jgi:hypothetical protein
VRDRAIHVFIVGRLDDLDEPGAIAYGVTWHRGDLIVSDAALERTLAHELGLPHGHDPLSIMNRDEDDTPSFSDEELAKLRRRLRE